VSVTGNTFDMSFEAGCSLIGAIVLLGMFVVHYVS
jgi:hypothetical protein